MADLFYAAACQTDFPSPMSRDEIPDRVTRMCQMAEQAILGYEPFFDVRLLAFPEFAHSVPVFQTVDELIRKIAVPVPNEHTERYEKLCKKYGCFIQTGSFIEMDPDFPGCVFNTTVLVGPDGILSKYRKINPWLPWEVHSSPHDFPDYPDDPFPVVETELGKIGVATCYDWLFPETIRELAFKGAEILIRISAYMDPWGTATPTDWWTLINRTRALENTAFVLAVNQGAAMKHYPPFSWPGGSMLVDYDGRIIAQADPGPGEKVVVAPINVASLRQERERRLGHDMRSHFRSEVHTYYRKPQLAPGGNKPHSIDSLRKRILDSKSRLDSDED
jgi:formamidase